MKLKLSIGGLLLALAPAWAADINCSDWQVLPNEFKLGYAAGFGHGFSLAQQLSPNVPDVLGEITRNKVVEGITNICTHPENANIAMEHAASVFMLQLAGGSQQKVDDALAEARRAVIDHHLDRPRSN